jgi:hypothetical protein
MSAEMQELWNEAKAVSADTPPEGTFQAIVNGFDTFETKDGDATFLKTEFKIRLDPDYDGMPVEAIHTLTDSRITEEELKGRLGWLKQHLSKLGLDVDAVPFHEIENMKGLAELLDVPVEIYIKHSDRTKKDGTAYVNTYVNARLGGPVQSDVPVDDPSNGTGATQVEDDSDIPF